MPTLETRAVVSNFPRGDTALPLAYCCSNPKCGAKGCKLWSADGETPLCASCAAFEASVNIHSMEEDGSYIGNNERRTVRIGPFLPAYPARLDSGMAFYPDAFKAPLCARERWLELRSLPFPKAQKAAAE